MPGIAHTEEPHVMDPHEALSDCQLAGLGDEFHWDGTISKVDVSDLECHPVLVSELQHDPDRQAMQSTAHF